MKITVLNLFYSLMLLAIVSGCKSSGQADFKNGKWRASLKTESGAEIPFNFEVSDSAGKKRIDILNGKERFRVNEITVSRDSVHIQMPIFDSEFKAAFEGDNIRGKWIKHLANKDTEMEFYAEPNADWRFLKASQEAAQN